MTLTDTMIRLSQFRAGKWLWKLLKDYEEPMEMVQMEQMGDLQELDSLMTHHLQQMLQYPNNLCYVLPLEKMYHMHKFLMAAEHTCTPEDLDEIKSVIEFKDSYPLLYDLMVTWAWG